MRSVQGILEIAAPLRNGFVIDVLNPPWQPLILADMQIQGPNGCPVISVFQCDMQEEPGCPQMSFEIQRFELR